jgi:poly(A) polymerase/tRNA nucleotidyltransferase (CCA-adding enzyme)
MFGIKLFPKFRRRSFPKGALYVIEVLKNSGHRAYFVGGCVRDLLLRRRPAEFDITTDATPLVIQKLFKKVIPTGIEFGTVTVVLDEGSYEVTTFRSDERYLDGRHPEKVTFTKSLEEDLSRRDFTINAMAYDPFSDEFVDIFSGRTDLRAKTVRTVGDPVDRFREDGLRPVRACRFAAKLNFKIEEKTLRAIGEALDRVKMVAPERIHDEIAKMLAAKKPSIGFEYMRVSGLLKLIMPELVVCFGVSQPEPFHKFDVYWHSLHSCDALPKDNYPLRLAGLLHDISKPACKVGTTFYEHDTKGAEVAGEILKRLRFSNSDIDYVKNLIKNHMFNYTKEWSDSAVRRFMRRVGVSSLDDLFLLRVADIKAMEREVPEYGLDELRKRIARIIEEENALHVKDLKVSGEDVMKILGIGPGPRVGAVLNSLLEKVLDDPSLNARESLLKLIKSGKG